MRRRVREALLAGLVVLAAGPAPAEAAAERPLRFGRLTTQNGLSSNWAHAILQDRQGFLWIGTQDGLNRYDGSSIRVYRHDPKDPYSLPSPVAGALLEDREGRLWVGSGWGDAGVSLYDRRLDRFTTFRPAPGERVGNAVRSLLQDRRGRIWAGTDDGVAELDPATGAFRRLPPPAGSDGGRRVVLAMLEDTRGRFWLGTYTGLLRLDREKGAYEPALGRPGSAGVPRTEIWALHEDTDGRLWIATLGAGLHRFDPETGQDESFLPASGDPRAPGSARIRRIVPAGDGRLYLGTENGGLEIFDPRQGTFEHYRPDLDDGASLNSGSIWSLASDDQGTLWIGTYNGGVNFLSPYQQRFDLIEAGRGRLSDPHVTAVLEDREGMLWVGTDGGGLDRYDPSSGRFTYYRSRPDDPTTIGSDSVNALLEDSRGQIWVGGWASGLARVDRATGRARRYRHDPRDPRSIVSDHVWRMLELRTGEMLVVTQAGADLFDRDRGTFTRLGERYPGAGDGVLHSATEDLAGNIWIAAADSARFVDVRSGRVTRYRNDDPRGLGGGWIQAVIVDRTGNVWFGTQRGLSCFAADRKRWRRYTTANGLADDNVLALLEDGKGGLWAATSRGISWVVDAASVPDAPAIHSFDANDGLQALEFSRNACAKGRGETLYFGGSAGLNAFRPEEIVLNPRPPRVALTGLRVMGRAARLDASEELRLSYRDVAATFEFAALDFAVPRKNRFRYRLEGLDPGWSDPTAQHEATYTNLPWGRPLTFRVKAANNDGVWNEEGVALRVFVEPPFWATPLFRGGVVILLLGAGVVAYRRRVNGLRRRADELTRKVNEAVASVKVLRGMLPICSHCKRIRSDEGYWQQIEAYLHEHSEADFTHGICPECITEHFPDIVALRAKRRAPREGDGGGP
ncbi:MAG: two-component regulator propeller domain-containing protein [Vicinamibacteria bacterium]